MASKEVQTRTFQSPNLPHSYPTLISFNASCRFAEFPQRIQAILAPCGIEFEPVVYPAFDTRGELRVAGKSLIPVSTRIES